MEDPSFSRGRRRVSVWSVGGGTTTARAAAVRPLRLVRQASRLSLPVDVTRWSPGR